MADWDRPSWIAARAKLPRSVPVTMARNASMSNAGLTSTVLNSLFGYIRYSQVLGPAIVPIKAGM